MPNASDYLIDSDISKISELQCHSIIKIQHKLNRSKSNIAQLSWFGFLLWANSVSLFFRLCAAPFQLRRGFFKQSFNINKIINLGNKCF